MGITNFRVAGFVLGLGIKAPVHTVSIVNIPTLSGVGANIGGWLVGENDRILLTAQSNPINNGIYSARTSAWVRDGDADGNRDFVGGTLIPVWNPSLTDIQLYRLEGNPNAKTVGVDSLVFSLYYDPSSPGGGEDLQATTVLGNITDQGLVLRDNPFTQSLTIQQTLNPASLTTTGASIQFLGASLEYFMDNALRVAGGPITAQQESFLSTNNLATAHMAMYHDNIDGVLEATDGDVDIRVDNGAAVQINRIKAEAGAIGSVYLYWGTGVNAVFRTNSAGFLGGDTGRITGADVKDQSDTYQQVGMATMIRFNIGGAANLVDNIWHRRMTAVSPTTATIDAADHANIPEGAVCWWVGNGGSITLTEGVGMVFKKFLGGGAAVNGTVTIADGGWATMTKNLDGEFWFVGQDMT